MVNLPSSLLHEHFVSVSVAGLSTNGSVPLSFPPPSSIPLCCSRRHHCGCGCDYRYRLGSPMCQTPQIWLHRIDWVDLQYGPGFPRARRKGVNHSPVNSSRCSVEEKQKKQVRGSSGLRHLPRTTTTLLYLDVAYTCCARQQLPRLRVPG